MNVYLLLIVFMASLLVVADVDSQEAAGFGSIRTIAAAFSSEEEYIFAAKIVAPPENKRNGYGVLMIGGGYSNDLNWTAPGVVGIGDEAIQLTINGKSHADAPLLAASIAEKGFVRAADGQKIS